MDQLPLHPGKCEMSEHNRIHSRSRGVLIWYRNIYMSHACSYESAPCMGYSVPREAMPSLGPSFRVRCATYMDIRGYAYARGRIEFKFQQCIHIVGWAKMNFLQVHNSATCSTH
jgi:hypothetical protein